MIWKMGGALRGVLPRAYSIVKVVNYDILSFDRYSSTDCRIHDRLSREMTALCYQEPEWYPIQKLSFLLGARCKTCGFPSVWIMNPDAAWRQNKVCARFIKKCPLCGHENTPPRERSKSC